MLSPRVNVNAFPRHACRLGWLLGAMFSLPAAAGPPGPLAPLRLSAGLGYVHDDNLLRVADGEPGFDNQLSDSWLQAEAALLFNKTLSRQKLSAEARFSKIKFDHFQQLDYDGKDLKAGWDWELGNHLHGQAGIAYAQTLAPYTDFHSDRRNLRKQRRRFLDGAWRFHPSWQARAGASTETFSYELPSQRFNDRTEDAFEAGVDYLAPSGSTLGLVARRVEGEYPNGRPAGGAIVAADYRQDEVKARLTWQASGATTVQALAGWARRRQDAFGQRTSGLNGRVSAAYRPHAQWRLNGAVWREFAPLESVLVSYTRNNGASIGAAWDASARLRFDASAVYERRNYNIVAGPPGELGGARDSVRSASVSATWAPLRAMVFNAAWSHQERSGNTFLGIGGFTSNSFSLNASAQF